MDHGHPEALVRAYQEGFQSETQFDSVCVDHSLMGQTGVTESRRPRRQRGITNLFLSIVLTFLQNKASIK